MIGAKLRDMRILVSSVQIEAQIERGWLLSVFLVKKMFIHLQKSNFTEPDIIGPFPDGWCL
jgi:hypothetical protein